jgi:hypothetical protein
VRVGSSPDNDGTCQHRQMVWARQARRKGVTRANQHLNAPQEQTTSSNLTDQGWVVTRTRRGCRGTLELVDVAGSEAVVNVCGVATAKSQGHSWAPTLPRGSRMNVGTILSAPPFRPSRAEGGKVRRRLMLSGWGGGPVVVRAQESCVHGEGVQCVCSRRCRRGGRW